MKRIFILFYLLGISFNLMAIDFTYEGITYTVINENSKICKTKDGYEEESSSYTAGNNVTGDIIIPETVYRGSTPYTVVIIGNYSFYNNEITSIQLPNSILEIGSHSFEECDKLKEITLSNSLKTVHDCAFSSCI